MKDVCDRYIDVDVNLQYSITQTPQVSIVMNLVKFLFKYLMKFLFKCLA